MNILTVYLCVSTLCLGWCASLWSTQGVLNSVCKFAFVAVTVLGAVMAARALGVR